MSDFQAGEGAVKFEVVLPDRRPVHVEADLFNVEHGALVFSVRPERDPTKAPRPVLAYASGAWLAVLTVQEPAVISFPYG